MSDVVLALSEALLAHQVTYLTGLSEPEIWQLVRDRRRQFPRPHLLNCGANRRRLPVWEKRAIEQWVADNRSPLDTFLSQESKRNRRKSRRPLLLSGARECRPIGFDRRHIGSLGISFCRFWEAWRQTSVGRDRDWRRGEEAAASVLPSCAVVAASSGRRPQRDRPIGIEQWPTSRY
jgi:predicted DNA-binding transcriptional regulator AlpA